jgi:hypothetical protein
MRSLPSARRRGGDVGSHFERHRQHEAEVVVGMLADQIDAARGTENTDAIRRSVRTSPKALSDRAYYAKPNIQDEEQYHYDNSQRRGPLIPLGPRRAEPSSGRRPALPFLIGARRGHHAYRVETTTQVTKAMIAIQKFCAICDGNV